MDGGVDLDGDLRLAGHFEGAHGAVEGAGEAAKIIGNKEKDLQRIESEAYRKIQSIQGVADAKATEIYAAAYNQTKSSRELYDLVKTLETYKQVIDPSTTLVLTTESELYQLLNGVGQQP